MADVASIILVQVTALHMAHNVASVALPTMDSTCVIPGHYLDQSPEEQKMATPGTDIDPDPSTEEEGYNIRARKVKKKNTYNDNQNEAKSRPKAAKFTL